MTNVSSADSPLEAAAGAAGPDATGAFKLLNNETRLAILLALWEAYDPHAETEAVSFSELQHRVGVADSGGFNYHLGKLEGEFVAATEDGYVLLPTALELVGTVIAGTGTDATLEPTELDVPCNLCGAPTAITYRGGWLYHVCTECEGGFAANSRHPRGILFGEPFPPAALANRTPEEVFAAGVFRLLAVMAMKLGGLCPRCSGVVESTMRVCDDHDHAPGEVCPNCGNAATARIHWVCSVCKYEGGSSPGGAVTVHPAVVSFYRDHGVEVGYSGAGFEHTRELLGLLRDHEEEVVSVDPPRVRVTVRHSGDELRLTLDEAMNVVEASDSRSAS